jgi:hypothetical protein
MKRLLIIMVVALGALATAPGARAGITSCTTYITGPSTITGDVVVPDGASCSLGYVPPPTTLCCNPPPPPGFGPVHVTGNVTVGHGSSLTIGLNSTIAGNVQATNCGFVEFVSEGNEEVGGNVQVENCNGGATQGQPAFLSTGTGSRIDGNLQCQNNTGPCVLEDAYVGDNVPVMNNMCPVGSETSRIEANQIFGNVQVMNNVSPGAPSKIESNHISGNLQCQNNSPPPNGSGSTIAGNEQGQCVGF